MSSTNSFAPKRCWDRNSGLWPGGRRTISDHDIVYKIVTRAQWREAEKIGVFKGAAVDIKDGYIHFSTAEQVEETAARHFAKQDDLLLVGVSTKALGDALTYEPSRGGQLFPHLYAALPSAAVISVQELPLGPDGVHRFPEEINPAGLSGGPTRR